MNKEKLLELSDTLRGIAEGKEWEREETIGTGVFAPPCKMEPDVSPLFYLQIGAAIRLKPQPPQPDPYAELKAAHAAGKTIQCSANGQSVWVDLYEPSFGAPVENYRIKPEPSKVPLGPDDVMPCSSIRGQGYTGRWSNCHLPILNVTPDGILLARNAGDENTIFCNWSDLMFMFQINRSIPLTGKWDKDAWEPCYKLIEE